MRFGPARIAALLLLGAPLPAFAQAAPATASVMATALPVVDVDRAVRFYTTGLGMVVARTLRHGSVTETILSFETSPAAQTRAAGIMLLHDIAPGAAPANAARADYGRIILRVPDAAAIAARLKAAGYEAGTPQGVPGGIRVLKVNDPDGYSYEIVEIPASHG